MRGAPSRASRIAATVNAASPPLKSIAPRPYRRSPWITPANGSTVHSARSTPTTSSWPASSSGLRPSGAVAGRRAIRCALPAVGVGTISTWKPSGSRRVRSNSATSASLPGGLEVLIRTRSWRSVTTSLLWACAGWALADERCDGDRECCEPVTTMHDASLDP